MKSLRIGLLGLGTVGSGVAEILARHRRLLAQRAGVELHLVRALVRSPRRARQGAAANVPLTTRPEQVVQAPDIDLVVELMGGHEPALRLSAQALAAGKALVTANKALLAQHGAALATLAAKAHTDIYFEGAVAGGIPIIRTLREGLAGDRISRLRGILNGTTNFILSAMAAGQSYSDALEAAQQQGYAEADPTLDVNGRDAADKLAILMHLAFGTRVAPQALPCEGIVSLTPEVMADAAEIGCTIKLVAAAERQTVGGRDRLVAGVHPTLVRQHDPLSHVPANQNAIAVRSDALGDTLYQGAGAGSLPTGSAVVADLIEAARNARAGIAGRLRGPLARGAPALIRPAEARSAFYVRLWVDDRPGVLAAVAQVFAASDISLATVLQRDRGRGAVPLVITTHRTSQGAMQRALRRLQRLRAVDRRAHVLRLEDDARAPA